MSETLLAALLPQLDFIVIERTASGALVPQTPAPRWFVDVAMTSAGGGPATLGGALPFIDHVLEDAEAFWWSGKDGLVAGAPFAVSGATEEYLLRPRIATLQRRKLLVLERLTGLADTRPVLQAAREGRLEHERLMKKASDLRAPAETLVRLVGELLESDLTPAQREMARGVVRAGERLRAAVDGLADAAPPAE